MRVQVFTATIDRYDDEAFGGDGPRYERRGPGFHYRFCVNAQVDVEAIATAHGFKVGDILGRFRPTFMEIEDALYSPMYTVGCIGS